MGDILTVDRVRVTFFLMTYNQERYVRGAIEGAFSQTYSPLEIVISDDCSTDGTFAIIREMCEQYDGLHTIVMNRNTENLGLIGHINIIPTLSSGELIVYAAGDDISLPHRTAAIVDRYIASGRTVTSIHSPVYLIDIAGNREGTKIPPVISDGMSLKDMALSTSLIIGATHAFSRKLENIFGGIRYNKCIEDLVMGFRSAVIGGLEYIPEPLVLYRYESGITAVPDSRNQTYQRKVKREVSELGMHLAVFSQRREDLRHTDAAWLLPLVQSARDKALLKRKVLLRHYRFIKLMRYSMKRGMLPLFIKVWFRELKWRIFFPVKGLIRNIAPQA
jgi:glycosyltransferase involved in cell wall biosynthesis